MTRASCELVQLAPHDLGLALSSLRLCVPADQHQMQLSLSQLGQLSPVQAFRVGQDLQLFDGLKRLRAAKELGWLSLRVEVHPLDAAGAKVRLLSCNAGSGLSELEEAWLVRSLYREDGLNQPQIALLLHRHKSWVCRRLALAEGLSDFLTAEVRLGLLSPTLVRELGRLPRGNQEEVARVVVQRGLTTRQTSQLIDALLAVPEREWPRVLSEVALPAAPAKQGHPQTRTPGEHLVADAWALKRMAGRLHARLLERSLESLGEPVCATVSRELTELRSVLGALTKTLDTRLSTSGEPHAPLE